MNNLEGLQPSVLTVFGGLVTEVDSPTIPAGSSPVCCDMDFDVSSIKTRDGIQNVFSYTGFSEEFNASAGANESGTGQPWTNPNNIVHNTPGTYASVSLNGTNPSESELLLASAYPFSIPLTSEVTGVEVIVNGKQFFTVSSGGGSVVLDVANIGTANFGSSNGPVGPVTPTAGTEYGLLFISGITEAGQYIQPSTPAAGWTNIFLPTPNRLLIYSNTVSTSVTPNSVLAAGWGCFAGVIGLFHENGSAALVQSQNGGFTGSGAQTLTFSSNVTAGNTVILAIGGNFGANLAPTSISDSLGNVYTQVDIANQLSSGLLTTEGVAVYYAQQVIGGACTVHFTVSNVNTYDAWVGEFSGFIGAPQTGGTIAVTPNTLNLVPETKTASLPIADGSVTFGSPVDTWGQYWTPQQINNPSFGFGIEAIAPNLTNAASAFISGVEVIVWYTPPKVTQFDYIKTFAETDGTTLTLALDNTGTFWQEDAINNSTVLTPFYTAIEPDTFAVSVTEDDREFIALSDLQQGTDMPRQYNGQWVDRISQVGPGVGPQITPTSNSYPITTITQAAAETLGDGTKNYTVTWTANYGSIGPAGNILSFEAKPGFFTDIIAAGVGASIIIAGVQDLNGQNPNSGQGNVPAVYKIISVGTVNTAFWGANTPYFSVLAIGTNSVDQIVQNGATYQLTEATVTTSVTVPNLQVGQQMTITGNTQATYNSTWTVNATPNAAQMTITNTSLSGNVATYDFILVTGTAPTPGQQVTVTGTTNGNGIFNITNQVVSAASAGSFSVQIVSPDIPSAPETGSGIVNGTIFEFDPLENVGNGTGGDIVIAGGLGAGTRGAVVMFLTRNGYITAPGPQTIFSLNADASSLTVSGIPIGPPNVVARIIAFTGAGGATQTGGGGFYYWIEEPVTVIDNGQQVTYNATIINDNVTMQATLSFTDAILLAATGISVDGNNLFAQIELGSSIGLATYSDRLVAWGEQNKVQNLLNFSFDGGVGQTTGVTITTFPLGWTVDPTNGAGGSLIASPLFGNAYFISNTSGSTQTTYGMITQPAFQDQLKVPIIQSATAYSVRVTASIPAGNTTGNLVVDLFSPSTSTIWGSFTIPFASLSTTMQIETGNLLTVPFGIVPSDLLIRIYATNIANNANVEIDRIEPFPTLNPVLTTQLRFSYAENFEAFDQITGNLGASQNQQPIRNVFELFDNLYIVKTKSFFSTSDNGTTEPNFWNVRTVSDKVGTPSIHGVDVGEGWALVAGEAGLYIFTGGDPVKISPELDGNPGLWQSINWKYGYTLWLRNDTTNRKIYIGIPIATPNQWMPAFPANANPTQPNVVLMMNYKELMTGSAIESEGPVRLTYTGELRSFPLGRKWSAWSIEACYADFITRADTTEPIFFCSDDSPEIFQQITGIFNDQGAAIPWRYFTYPFPKVQEAQQFGWGVDMLQAEFMTMTVKGSGNLNMAIYPNSIDTPYAETIIPEALADPLPYGDMEIPIGGESASIAGNRFFVEFYGLNPGDWMELSKMTMALSQNVWAPTRGRNI